MIFFTNSVFLSNETPSRDLTTQLLSVFYTNIYDSAWYGVSNLSLTAFFKRTESPGSVCNPLHHVSHPHTACFCILNTHLYLAFLYQTQYFVDSLLTVIFFSVNGGTSLLQAIPKLYCVELCDMQTSISGILSSNPQSLLVQIYSFFINDRI